ncbi:uncharacterized protein [Malus domestica]|uniref:uncharacterized protein n=1 Tax=Malus domestica TaxID=3750 RepID=UPI0039752979
MSKAPLLSKPEVSDTLIIYLSVSASAISSVLIRNDGNVERPVYYANKAVHDAETRYSNIEKLALALAITLGEFDISYQPKPAEKGQAVADFIVDFTYPVDIVSKPKEVVTNNFEAKDNSMAAYLAQTQLLLKHFHYQITQIPKAANNHADALARLTSAVEDKIGRKIQV